MKLQQTNESVSRSFNAQGEPSEEIMSKQFQIVDDNDVLTGTVTVHQTSADIDIHPVYGFSNIDEGVARVKEILGISE